MNEPFDTRGEAIVTALDELQPGGTLVVHEKDCLLAWTDVCSCQPETWIY